MMDDSGITGIKPPGTYPVPGTNLLSSYSFNGNTTDENIIPRISKSSLGTFQFCEHQYFIKYILGVKEAQNDDMIRGTNVHEAIDSFYESVDIEEAKKILDDEGPVGVLFYFMRLLPPTPVNERNGTDEKCLNYLLGEMEHMSKLMRSETARFVSSEPDFFLPVINEDSLDAVIDVEVDGKTIMVHLTGIIDRAFSDPDGNLHVHELKTGLWKHSDFKKESMQKEMAYYVYLLRKSKNHPLSGKTCTFWGWDHTKGDVAGSDAIYRFVENVRSDAIQKMLTDIKSLIRMHLRYTGNKHGWMFPIKPDGWATANLCEPWCRVKGFCSKYHRVLMPHDMKLEAGIND